MRAFIIIPVLTWSFAFAQKQHVPIEHRPLRFIEKVERFEAMDRSKPPTPGQVVLAGSSTFGLWSSAAADLAPYPLINRGFNGAYSTEILAYMDRVVLPLKPRVVLYFAGNNDIAFGDPVHAPVSRAKRFAERLQAVNPKPSLVILSAPLVPARKMRWKEFSEYNAGVAGLAQSMPRVWYVDINPALNQPDGEPRPDTYLPDALHPSPAGYAAMAKLIRPALDAAWKAGEGR